MNVTTSPLTPAQAAQLATARTRHGLTAWETEFLADLGRRTKPLSDRQAATLARIAAGPPDYAAVNSAALARLPEVVARLLPGGRQQGAVYFCASLRGGEGRSCQVRLTGARRGAWADFAADVAGGDPVSLAAAVAGLTQAEAAERLAQMLGLPDGSGRHG
ncbi:hypothetical protein M0638_25595 [Roseomonas sp. NAR14]|uniref:Uncharacterized protein n=1 Tax=Roseomonas acroporae TaxID=2937791 RepID=A0A9X2C041_9PROT|nr:hypothetical protein [Roseomonas acroporae]MCK8787740.1 hypothetical protein [Roseomonas acroporae]